MTYEEAVRQLDVIIPQIEKVIKERNDFLEALKFYANPETYHATSLWCDRPCGLIGEDFSEDHNHPDYPRPMLGKTARDVLRSYGIPFEDEYDI